MHSSLIAEPIAHICGLAAGFAAYGIAGFFTHDFPARLMAGMVTSALTNALIGGHINFLAKDFLSLVVWRPISIYLGAKLFQLVIQAVT